MSSVTDQCVCSVCVQEAQWQIRSGPADEDDGRHAGEGWSGSAEWAADAALAGRQTEEQMGSGCCASAWSPDSNQTPQHILMYDILCSSIYFLNIAMECLTDGGSAGAGAGWAEHLQHCFPWSDPAGQRGLCWEGTAACQAQVSSLPHWDSTQLDLGTCRRSVMSFTTKYRCKREQISNKTVPYKIYINWIMLLSTLVNSETFLSKTFGKFPATTQEAFFSEALVFVYPDSATSPCWSGCPAAWRLCTLRQWHSGLWTAGSLRRSTTSRHPSSNSART